MSKSAYQNPEFANFWNEISGKDGQVYKKYVVDPVMLKLAPSLRGKRVLDLGCGNGYMGPKLVSRGAKKVILMDLSRENLRHAEQINTSSKVEFVCANACKKWPLSNRSVDVVYSDMFLNEVKNIKTPLREMARVIKKRGKAIIAITHPAWDLFEYARKKFGKKAPILKGARGYFQRGYNFFLMSTESLNPNSPYKKTFQVEHFQRPLQDYFDHFLDAGFQVDRVVEPELSKSILAKYPGYKKMKDHPIGIVFSLSKCYYFGAFQR